MADRIKGPARTAFEGCEFMRGMCAGCVYVKIGEDALNQCPHVRECVDLVGADADGHWIKSAPEQADGRACELSDALSCLQSIEEISRLAPELNPCNYNHDDVCRLNAAMCEIYQIAKKFCGKPIRAVANEK